MAVIVKYVVVRNGDEKMTFATKKEADAYDKMLDIADSLYEFFEDEELPLDEQQKELVSMSLAKNKDSILSIMKGIKVQKKLDVKKNDSKESEISDSGAKSLGKKGETTGKSKGQGRKTARKSNEKAKSEMVKEGVAGLVDEKEHESESA